MNSHFIDHSCGLCSFVTNLLYNIGWNKGKSIDDWIARQLEEKCGNANITFKEVWYLQHICTDKKLVVKTKT